MVSALLVPFAAGIATAQEAADEMTMGGVVVSGLRALEGARVTVTPVAARADRLVIRTDEEGKFHIPSDLAGEQFRITVEADAYKPKSTFVIKESLEDYDLRMSMSPEYVYLSGQVLISNDGSRTPVEDARIFLLADETLSFVGKTDAGGRFKKHIFLYELGADKETGRVVVDLPVRLAAFGRFEPGATQVQDFQLEEESIDIGTVEFRALENPKKMVEVSGRLQFVDSLGGDHTQPVDGLKFQIDDALTGETVATAETDAGEWSVRIPKGKYSVSMVNQAELGVRRVSDGHYRIEFGRDDIDKRVLRVAPKPVSLQDGKLRLTYPDLGLAAHEAVFRSADGSIETSAILEQAGREYIARVPNGMINARGISVALRFGGVTTDFSANPIFSEAPE